MLLVAITSSHRISTFHALSVESGLIRWEPSGVRFVPKPEFFAKNQKSSSPLVEIFLPSISSFSSIEEDKVWCPVRALKWYLNSTKSKRTSTSLFVTTVAPFKEASKSTISRWLVECIKMAGPEAIIGDKLRGHDTRFVSASWALFYEAPMLDIQGAAFWANLNSFIFCYLKDVFVW